MTARPIPIRLEEALLERIDCVAEALQKRAAGAPVPRAVAMRVAMERGLDALETELGLGSARRSTRPKHK
jgi:hypothetical protein